MDLVAKQPPSSSNNSNTDETSLSKASWFKGGSLIKHTSRISISSSNNLIIRRIQVVDAGRYTLRDVDGGSRENCTDFILFVTGLNNFYKAKCDMS